MKATRIVLLTAALFLPAMVAQTAYARPDGHRVRRVGVAVTVRFGAEARERRHQRKVERIKRGKQIDALKADRRTARDKLRRGRREQGFDRT